MIDVLNWIVQSTEHFFVVACLLWLISPRVSVKCGCSCEKKAESAKAGGANA